MKKIILGIIITGIFAGCSSSVVKNPQKEKKVTWEYAGELPAQKGYDKNIGTAGILAGSVDKYIIAGGGENFPEKSVLEGEKGRYYSDIYMLREKDGMLQTEEHINIENEIGYGASVTAENGIYYVGGSSNSEAANDILFFYVEDKKLQHQKIGELPFTFEKGQAVYKDGKLYIIAGKQNEKAVNKMYEYNLETGETRELASVPGAKGRTQFVAQILNDSLYVFSGGDITAYTDGYRYSFQTGRWTEVSPVIVNGKEISLFGAASVKLNESEMLVIGGFNKEVYDNAVKKMGTLRGQELLKFKASYFGADPEEFKWNREVLIYNAETNSWKSIGEITFNAPCGEGLVLIGNKIYSINGEIKPGVRTPKIYAGEIKKAKR